MSDAPRPAVPGGTGRGGPEVPQDARGEAAGVLVVGLGNPLRRDDGVGPAVAELVAGTLAADPRLGGAAVLAVHQLTPDLAVDLATARRAIFVDATVEAGPGEVVTRRVAAGGAAGSGGVAGGEAATGVAAGRGGGPSSHHVGVDALLRLAAELYGQAPPATIVSIGVADLEVGEGLSSAVAAAVPRAVEAVLAAMTEVAPASVDAAGTSPAASPAATSTARQRRADRPATRCGATAPRPLPPGRGRRDQRPARPGRTALPAGTTGP